MRQALAACALTLTTIATLVGCTTNDSPNRASNAPEAVTKTSGCHETQYDLSKEPNYAVDYIHRWTTEEGCDVRLDVLMMRQGENGCGGAKVADILMGTPLGRPHGSSPARIYVKDPTNVFDDAHTSEAFDSDASLPDNAVDSGYRQDGAELWVTPDDDRSIYLVLDERVEKWPQDDSPPGCA